MNQFSAKAFQRKIDAFCQLRLAPLFKDDELPRLKWYLHTLIETRRPAPRASGGTDWHVVAAACGLDTNMLAGNARQIDPAFDAIGRWIRDTRLVAAAAEAEVRRTQKTPRTKAVPTRPRPARAPQHHPKPASGATAASTDTNLEFPEALFNVREDPAEFSEALQLQLRRHGETYWTLYRAIIGPDDVTEKTTLLSWIEGRKVPRTVESFEILSRIERRYRLATGYFKSKLAHPSRSASGFELSGIEPAERRRIAWHLPEDFNTLSFQKREEIVDWVRRVIISGTTDYRKYQAAAAKQRYAIRFPGVSYGGRAPRDGKIIVPANYEQTWVEDPDLLSGVIEAPPALAMEISSLNIVHCLSGWKAKTSIPSSRLKASKSIIRAPHTLNAL